MLKINKENAVDILIGMDYFCEFVNTSKEVRPGFFIVNSIVGEMYAGKILYEAGEKLQKRKAKAIVDCSLEEEMNSLKEAETVLKEKIENDRIKYEAEISQLKSEIRDLRKVVAVQPDERGKSVQEKETKQAFQTNAEPRESARSKVPVMDSIKTTNLRVEQNEFADPSSFDPGILKISDDEIRTCEIQYADGFVTRRAVNHLYPLEEGAVNDDVSNVNQSCTGAKEEEIHL